MTIETAIKELFESGICHEDNVETIRDVLEELSYDSYHLGYKDGQIDFEGYQETFVAYGKKEDFR